MKEKVRKKIERYERVAVERRKKKEERREKWNAAKGSFNFWF